MYAFIGKPGRVVKTHTQTYFRSFPIIQLGGPLDLIDSTGYTLVLFFIVL
jgi:hypothetical protein